MGLVRVGGIVGLSIVLIFSVLLTAFALGDSTTDKAVASPSGGIRVSGFFNSLKELPNAPGLGVLDNQFCTDGTAFGSNVRVNCDSTIFPHDETSVAVDPRDPSHIVGGSNDYELFYVGGSVVVQVIAGYYVSFDSGKTWTNGHVPPGGFTLTGDPAVAFNSKFGVVHYAVVALQSGQAAGLADPSVQVSTSTDGGLSYGKPVVVALGTGGTGVTVFNDKPYIAVDNNPSSPFYGRLYVTYTRFLFGPLGSYIQSPIFFAFSDDGGNTFTAPKEISGHSDALCPKQVTGQAGQCDEDQFSSPAVGPDGTLYVAFENEQLSGAPEFRDQYLVVRSTDGGMTFSAPSKVADLMDGAHDYPINIDGRQTLSNSQFRVNSAGNLAVDPSSGTVYVVWSDNRNGDNVTTNTNVFASKSTDRGITWSSTMAVSTAAGDQFYPWAAVGPDGKLRVVYMDRSYDQANSMYGITLATSTNGGRSFTTQMVSTALSDPNHSRWFSGRTNGKATFIGDYNGMDVGPDGTSHPFWTDMRVVVKVGTRSGTTQDAFIASVA